MLGGNERVAFVALIVPAAAHHGAHVCCQEPCSGPPEGDAVGDFRALRQFLVGEFGLPLGRRGAVGLAALAPFGFHGSNHPVGGLGHLLLHLEVVRGAVGVLAAHNSVREVGVNLAAYVGLEDSFDDGGMELGAAAHVAVASFIEGGPGIAGPGNLANGLVSEMTRCI